VELPSRNNDLIYGTVLLFNKYIKVGATCISMHITKYITKLHLMTGAGAK
jgi:hypothetical protein